MMVIAWTAPKIVLAGLPGDWSTRQIPKPDPAKRATPPATAGFPVLALRGNYGVDLLV